MENGFNIVDGVSDTKSVFQERQEKIFAVANSLYFSGVKPRDGYIHVQAEVLR